MKDSNMSTVLSCLFVYLLTLSCPSEKLYLEAIWNKKMLILNIKMPILHRVPQYCDEIIFRPACLERLSGIEF